MRKIKVNYEQVLDVLTMHLEAIGAISPSERVELTPFFLRNGMITITVSKAHM